MRLQIDNKFINEVHLKTSKYSEEASMQRRKAQKENLENRKKDELYIIIDLESMAQSEVKKKCFL